MERTHASPRGGILSLQNMITMKRIFTYLLTLLLLCSCSTFKLANTVWYNVTPVEIYGEKCDVITSLYFWDEKTMNINTCVVQDSIIIAPPSLTANGTYIAKGNLKNGVNIELDVINSLNIKEVYRGLIKQEGMVLVSPDSIAKAYNKVSNVSLIPEKK